LAGAPPVPEAVADCYSLEPQALAASLTIPPTDDPTVLVLGPQAAELLLAFERDLEPRLAADSGDLAHLAGWAAKLAGATCHLAALLHLAEHLRDGWAQPISSDTLAAAIRLADYFIKHAQAVFDLMGADPRTDDARWLLDWIDRTNRTQFSRRDAHRAAPRGRFATATDLEPACGCSRSTATSAGSTPSPPRTPAAAADPPRRGSWSTRCRAPQK
jgi:replicative DNA helicase